MVLTESYDDTVIDPEERRVIEWRMEWLRAAGYSKRNARVIAERTSIDWRFACDLLKNSDNQTLAMKILL